MGSLIFGTASSWDSFKSSCEILDGSPFELYPEEWFWSVSDWSDSTRSDSNFWLDELLIVSAFKSKRFIFIFFSIFIQVGYKPICCSFRILSNIWAIGIQSEIPRKSKKGQMAIALCAFLKRKCFVLCNPRNFTDITIWRGFVQLSPVLTFSGQIAEQLNQFISELNWLGWSEVRR